ncbi:uncharacterized protein BDCG_05047 [Blastomyces dermatitidis ER-3]|uniref:Uncharacterized protein n=1 Tax=Ajellomyces dermatitidis (strain ER-3 / ATCC MYA-2586) TaxID=559297 RepID=A0ABP2F017_AJEDR|nr:uncharacterized protein BDCG_05047 [Blastomyces dermatitidis ER-3]EEQ89927.1 hypothetical protein BDCG_05047 [Blastomyces dermatitidis ER-3]
MSLLSKRLFRACCCEVLVPELLEMLVREDMGVDARGARRILKESNKIGKLLNLERIDCDTLRRWQRSTASDFTLDHNQTVTLFLTNRHNFLETYTAPMAQPVSLASGGRGLWGMNREFEDVINTFVTHPAGSRASFRDWAKLTSMGEGIGRFRLMLAGYKSTMNIALGDATLYASLRCIFPIKLTIWLIAAEQYAN